MDNEGRLAVPRLPDWRPERVVKSLAMDNEGRLAVPRLPDWRPERVVKGLAMDNEGRLAVPRLPDWWPERVVKGLKPCDDASSIPVTQPHLKVVVHGGYNTTCNL